MNAEEVLLTDIKQYPNNPRKGNVNLIAESLANFGQYKPITINRSTGEILVGNHTYEAAKSLGWKTIQATYIDVDAETAAKIVVIDNRTNDLGSYDHEALLELLENLNDLEHTGYTDDEYDDVLARIEEEKTPNVIASAPQAEAERLTELTERYMTKDTKVVMIELENSLYVWAVEQLVKYRSQNGLLTNSEGLVKLLETKYEEKAPK